MYLELIAPDPEQPEELTSSDGRFDFGGRRGGRLVHWAAHTTTLAVHQLAADWGLQTPFRMSRTTPAGDVLEWSLAVPAKGAWPPPGGGLLPFLIDWEQVLPDGNHPALTAPRGCLLRELRLAHPDPAGISASLQKVGLQLPVAQGPEPALSAVLDCPNAVEFVLSEAFFDEDTSTTSGGSRL